MPEENRDLSMSRLLSGEARPSPEPREADVCPDAETIAAWSDHGLASAERARLEVHFAGCARCQMHLATMARMPPAEPELAAEPGLPAEPELAPSKERPRIWKWLVPATGAAAAAGLWFLVQAPATPTQPALPERPAEVQVRPPEQQSASIPRPDEPAAREEAKANRQQFERFTPERRGQAAGNAAPAAPPPSAAGEASQRTFADSVIVDTRAADAYQINVQRSDDGRVTWETRAGEISAQVTAGASPAPSVIWLVGKGGLVLLSTDGRSWRRRPFPETTDLTRIDASSDAAATVTTADARTFTTSDGGLTWQRQ